MLDKTPANIVIDEADARERLNQMSEKQLLIEMIIELKKLGHTCNRISHKCDKIISNIVLWS